jgi:hypothetical protein
LCSIKYGEVASSGKGMADEAGILADWETDRQIEWRGSQTRIWITKPGKWWQGGDIHRLEKDQTIWYIIE